MWEPGNKAWENKLAALRSYRRATGHLAPRQNALWGEGEAMVPVGQHLANLRRKGGLGKDPERAVARAQQLEAIDPDWNCEWPLDWQRHYRALADLVDADGTLPDIQPGVLFNGDDIGKWLQRQKQPGTWAHLFTEQQERLVGLGVTPAEARVPVLAGKSPAKGTGKAQQAFQRGLTAFTQWIAREGDQTAVPRGHIEPVVIEGQEHQHKLGVWYANQKQRRDKLTPEQRAALTELGVEWV